MADGDITLTTSHGEVTMPLAQALTMGEACEKLEDPVWHFNECGCCISVHERADNTKGYVINAQGEGFWEDSNGAS